MLRGPVPRTQLWDFNPPFKESAVPDCGVESLVVMQAGLWKTSSMLAGYGERPGVQSGAALNCAAPRINLYKQNNMCFVP